MEKSHDLQNGPADPKENYMPALSGDLAAGKKIVPKATFSWISDDLPESFPKRVEVNLLLLRSPLFQSIGANQLQI